ncbi:hypothetical protein KKI24_20435 [bacterium]|nr:hypothetical protein [bacterium]
MTFPTGSEHARTICPALPCCRESIRIGVHQKHVGNVEFRFNKKELYLSRYAHGGGIQVYFTVYTSGHPPARV